MKITQLEVFPVRPRWVFLKVHTDEGIVGLGEPSLEGYAHTVAQAVQEMGRFLIGQDPRRIEHLWQALYRGEFYRGGPVLLSAISGIEQALWDILGKWLGVPVWQLLGGPVRERVRVYAHIAGETPDDLARHAEQRLEEGYTAVKFSPVRRTWPIDTLAVVKGVRAKVAAVRRAIGDENDFMLDFHGRVSPPMAILLAEAVAEFHPLFIEEPCLPENVDALARIAQKVSVPIATGERLFTKWGFRQVLEKQAASVIQPDPCHAGGISECKKIAAMAEAYFVSVAPHNPLGPIATAACLHLDASIPNFLIQEVVSLGQGYLKEPFVVEKGFISLPTRPGLGIELDEEALKRLEPFEDWKHVRWYHADGSVADW